MNITLSIPDAAVPAWNEAVTLNKAASIQAFCQTLLDEQTATRTAAQLNLKIETVRKAVEKDPTLLTKVEAAIVPAKPIKPTL